VRARVHACVRVLSYLLTDETKTACGEPATATAAAAALSPSFSLSLYNADTVNAAQFVQLVDLCLADCTDDKLVRQLMTFVCEGFVQSREELDIRRQQVTNVHYRAMLCSRGTSHGPVSVCMSVSVSVCLSVTSRSSTKMAKQRITHTIPHDSPGTLVF